MIRFAVPCLALLLASAPLAANEGEIAGPPRIAAAFPKPALSLEGGKWFDGQRFVEDHWYSIDGKLTRTPPPRIDVRIYLDGRYVLPPLADAHNHNLQNAWTAATFADDYLRRGIFYSAQLAANAEEIAGYRGVLGGPGRVDVLWAEATLSSSDGHPLGLALAGAKQAGMPDDPKDYIDKSFWAIDSLGDLDAKWSKIAETRPELIKVIVVDDAHAAEQRKDRSSYGFRGMSTALLPEVVRRAHAIGARVAAHVDSADDIDRVVASGVDIVAHLNTRIPKGLTATDLRLSESTIAEMKRRGTKIIPTVAVTRYYLAAHPEDRAELLAVIRDNLTRLKAAGVPMLAGSDLFDGSVIDEVEALHATNVFTSEEVLALTTSATPRALFPDRLIGSFAEGAEASLIAYDGDPSKDLTILREPRLAIKQGEILSR
ncbi:amidohydrolase family protein [Sphingobium soli]|uniref:Amidohydrolase family protein n=1 Tax=Sphingobium soli TaxID=1591116 RepID=A0ABS8HAK4_9SPHN|nr:amidohydrolase family protein [Sphingobium soli]MCC4234108.1 amidohydrolase family protein [Sphingobium soli]